MKNHNIPDAAKHEYLVCLPSLQSAMQKVIDVVQNAARTSATIRYRRNRTLRRSSPRRPSLCVRLFKAVGG